MIKALTQRTQRRASKVAEEMGLGKKQNFVAADGDV
jgi:hypothetical protein